MVSADLRRLGAMTRGVIVSLGLAVDDLEAGHYDAEVRDRLGCTWTTSPQPYAAGGIGTPSRSWTARGQISDRGAATDRALIEREPRRVVITSDLAAPPADEQPLLCLAWATGPAALEQLLAALQRL
ncbi:hypothetical protein [Saccharopolyspora pogona]|uniref:hypothetical protein n=1 Tax=Saccharopolyspora pogona TaxID=333966 RepID=UPI001685D562|nr:hypothetical protein [Saccharopolyspora pogona]